MGAVHCRLRRRQFNSDPSTGEHGHGNGDRYVWIDKSFNPSHANCPVNAEVCNRKGAKWCALSTTPEGALPCLDYLVNGKISIAGVQ